jgi:endonuclease G, mitochondrial
MTHHELSPELLSRQVADFDAISRRHYGISFSQLLANVDTPLGRRQFARLMGVIVKEPFAIENKRKPSASTHARIGLEWKPDAEINSKAPGTWQLDFVRALASENMGHELSESEAISELTYFKYETSLGKFIFDAFRKRICGDPKASAAVRDAIKKAKKAGVTLVEPTAAHISVGAASVIAVAVASVLTPTLAVVASPVIGGIALLIMQVGVDGFCAWSQQVIESDAGLRSAVEV